MALGLIAAIVAIGVFSATVGDGALPATSLPAFGATNGNGSLSTVAELGDINGDGFGDYAVGLPSADVGGSTDAGIVYVFLGHGGALPSTPTAVNLASAAFEISGHNGEMLGYSIAGNDVNDDGLADIAIGAPMAGAPSKVDGGAVYVIFGRANPVDVNTTALSFAGYTNAGTAPPRSAAATTASPGTATSACPWPRCPTSTATATTISWPGRPTQCSTASRRRGRAVRQAAGRAHHAQRPLGRRLSVLLPCRLPGRLPTRTSARPSRASAT